MAIRNPAGNGSDVEVESIDTKTRTCIFFDHLGSRGVNRSGCVYKKIIKCVCGESLVSDDDNRDSLKFGNSFSVIRNLFSNNGKSTLFSINGKSFYFYTAPPF